MVEGLLKQEASTLGAHHGQPGATVDLLPAYYWRQEAGAMLYWFLPCSSLYRGNSISIGAI